MTLSSTLAQYLSRQYRPCAISAIVIAACLSIGCSNTTQQAATHDDGEIKSDITTVPAASTDQKSDAAVVSAIQTNLKASGIDQTITSAIPTDMPGIYWVSADGLPSFFTDKEGRHIIQGQIVQIGSGEPIDISASLIAHQAQEKLAAVDKKEMVIFPAKGETKGVIYAFTDADCGYCRKLHQEIDKTNALGVEVRYLAWPRSEQTVSKMAAIWCSEDRQAAMDQAKSGANISAPDCDNPVQSQLELGMSLGVRGTPAIFTEEGQQIGGYLPPAQIAEALGIS